MQRYKKKNHTVANNQFSLESDNKMNTLFYFISECAGCGIGEEKCSQHTCTSKCGYIASPNFPLPYAKNYRCFWHIKVKDKEFIKLTFARFVIDSTDNWCMADVVLLYDVTSGGSRQLIGRYCDQNLPPAMIYSSWNEMFLEFTSDDFQQTTGFLAHYTSDVFELKEGIKRKIIYNG